MTHEADAQYSMPVTYSMFVSQSLRGFTQTGWRHPYKSTTDKTKAKKALRWQNANQT